MIHLFAGLALPVLVLMQQLIPFFNLLHEEEFWLNKISRVPYFLNVIRLCNYNDVATARTFPGLSLLHGL